MADFLRVDIDALGELIAKLEESHERMGVALRSLQESGPERLGTDELDEACGEFQDTWRSGLGKIRELTRQTGEQLGVVRRMFAELDQGYAAGFDKVAGLLDAHVQVPRPGAAGSPGGEPAGEAGPYGGSGPYGGAPPEGATGR